MAGRDERVRERAYHLWQESGRDHGQDMDHWLRAEQEVSKTAAPSGKKPSAAAKKRSADAPRDVGAAEKRVTKTSEGPKSRPAAPKAGKPARATK